MHSYFSQIASWQSAVFTSGDFMTIATETEKTGVYYDMNARLAIYAPDALGKESSKTAEGVLRYAQNPVVAVIDKSQAGKTVRQVTRIPSDAPVVDSIQAALQYKPEALLLGTAWSGGELPEQWKPDIIEAISNGMDIINGLHDFLADDPKVAAAAKQYGRKLIDVRRPPEKLPVGTASAMKTDSFIVLTVGSDCSVGKMTTSLEVQKVAQKRGKKAAFVATGQTGIMICGSGVAIDRVIGDFMAGAVEEMIMQLAPGNEYVLVEGQGSIVHPSFSGVTLSLVHGSCPQAMVLCHNASRKNLKADGIDQELLPLSELVSIYERIASYMRPSKVVAVALNTHRMNEEEALKVIEQTERQVGLPTCDPVRQGADKLFDAIEKYKKEWTK